MTIIEELQALKQASAQQVAASQELSQDVSGKMAAIDKKANDSIDAVELAHAEKATELTIIATDGYRKSIEHNSGGRNTVIYDAQGNPNIMCVIPRFNIEDLGLTALNLGTGIHPAFQTNGVPRGEILIGKYLASNAPNGSAVIGGIQPRASVSYDVAKELCTRKGQQWHLFSAHEYAAIACWSFANNTVPRGNTSYGRSHEKKWETARRSDNGVPGDMAGIAATDTGKGPVTWNHDHSEFGICDLVGNLWEWVDQMRLDDGQIITTLDNNPALAESNWNRHAAYFDSPVDGQSGTGNAGAPVLSGAVTQRNGPINDDSHNYPYLSAPHFAAITKAAGYSANELLRRLLIESATATNVLGAIYARNYGDRFPVRGGDWSVGSYAGLGAINLNNARSPADGYIGFRPAFFV